VWALVLLLVQQYNFYVNQDITFLYQINVPFLRLIGATHMNSIYTQYNQGDNSMPDNGISSVTDSAVSRSGFGYGYDQNEALVDWLTNNEEFNAEGINYGQEALDRATPIMVQTIRQPRRAKRVHTDNFPQRGARKFTTAYKVISRLHSETVIFNEETEGLLMVQDPETEELATAPTHFSRQMAAINAAKDLARKTHQSYTVVIDKVLTIGQEIVADIRPGKSSPGEYRFTASFKY